MNVPSHVKTHEDQLTGTFVTMAETAGVLSSLVSISGVLIVACNSNKPSLLFKMMYTWEAMSKTEQNHTTEIECKQDGATKVFK